MVLTVRELYHVARFKRCLHAGCAFGLYADNLDAGVQHLCQRGNTRCKAAASDGNQNRVNKRKLLHDFHGDGALASRNDRVVERMDEGEAALFGNIQGVFVGLIVHIAGKDYLGTLFLRALYLDKRGGGGHNDGGVHAVLAGSVGNALGMVACRSGDKAALAFFVGQRADLVIGAADLVSAGALHVLGLKVNFVTRFFGKMRAVNQFGFLGYFLDLFGCFFKCTERQHGCPLIFTVLRLV